MGRKSRERLSLQKVLGDFRKTEESPAHRKGTFKIDARFEEALNTIPKVKPQPGKQHKGKGES